jgi:hypothetical protein
MFDNIWHDLPLVKGFKTYQWNDHLRPVHHLGEVFNPDWSGMVAKRFATFLPILVLNPF